MLHTFISKGWLFHAKAFSMVFGPFIEGVSLIGFKIGPTGVFHTISSKMNDILCKEMALQCKDFFHGVWSIHGMGLPHKFQD